MKKSLFGKGFAKAMAAAGAAGAAGIAAAAAAGAGTEGQKGVNSIVVTSSGSGGGTGSVSVTGIGATSGKVNGVTIIDGKVWINGEAIPDDATTHTSANGHKFTIRRENGRVSVQDE